MTQQENPQGEKRSYSDIYTEVEKYYEARGVGGDLVAFGDAIRMAELEERQLDFKQVRKFSMSHEEYITPLIDLK